MGVTLKDEKVMDRWSVLIVNGQGRAEELFDMVASNIDKISPPEVEFQMEVVKPGLLKGLMGKKREYLMVTNSAIKDYRMYIGARDYGKTLDVSWYLTVEPGFFKKQISKAITGSDKALSFNLDLFTQQDLAAYVSIVHHALLDAVEELMRDLGQDPSKIDRKSKGFLGVS